MRFEMQLVLLSIPPGRQGPGFFHHAEQIAKTRTVKWVGYLSTTGVYGNRDGGWVDETSDLRPSNLRSKRRVDAERKWLRWGDYNGISDSNFSLSRHIWTRPVGSRSNKSRHSNAYFQARAGLFTHSCRRYCHRPCGLNCQPSTWRHIQCLRRRTSPLIRGYILCLRFDERRATAINPI